MLLEKIVETVKTVTDAPDHLIEATAYWVLSSTIGRLVTIPFRPEITLQVPRPKIWLLVSGPSGISRKSAVGGLGRQIISSTWEQFFLKRREIMDRNTIKSIVSAMFVETGSPEGLVEYIHNYQDKVPLFIVFSTEFGVAFRKMSRPSYLEEMPIILSKLYSGESHVRKLRREMFVIKEGLYVTAWLATQELDMFMTDFLFRQGLMRRIVIVVVKPTDKTRWLPPLSAKRLMGIDLVQEVVEEIVDRMNKLRQFEDVTVDITSGALEIINNYALQAEKHVIDSAEAYGQPSFWALHYQNYWSHLVNMAALLAAADGTIYPRGDIGVVKMTEDHVNKAMGLLELLARKSRLEIEGMSSPKTPAVRESVNPLRSLAEKVVEEAGDDGITRAALARKLDIDYNMLLEIVISLVEDETIYASYCSAGKKGRPTIRFWHRRHASSIPENCKILGPRKLRAIW